MPHNLVYKFNGAIHSFLEDRGLRLAANGYKVSIIEPQSVRQQIITRFVPGKYYTDDDIHTINRGDMEEGVARTNASFGLERLRMMMRWIRSGDFICQASRNRRPPSTTWSRTWMLWALIRT